MLQQLPGLVIAQMMLQYHARAVTPRVYDQHARPLGNVRLPAKQGNKLVENTNAWLKDTLVHPGVHVYLQSQA